MTQRETLKTGFLARAGWQNADITPLAGDASLRRYDRVALGNRRAVLMDAPPDKGERIAPFVEIGTHLERLGLHPPAILAENRAAGFLLLEDLGDRLFAREFETDPARERDYYTAALEVLRALHSQPAPSDLPDYGSGPMAEAAGLAATWYAGAPADAPHLSAAMAEALDRLDWSRPVTVLRDYHAENLIWCSVETGLRRVGLLDFQDAALGHPVYDAASLMQDARRDIAPDLVADLANATWSWFAADRSAFDTAFAVLCAQRALRILGVFARLSLHFGKPAYVDLIPRVWSQLQGNLVHPALAPVSAMARELLPPPSQAHLDDLKLRAGTCPMR